MPCLLIYNGANGEMVSALRANGANDGMGEKNEQWHCHGTEEDGEWEK